MSVDVVIAQCKMTTRPIERNVHRKRDAISRSQQVLDEVPLMIKHGNALVLHVAHENIAMRVFTQTVWA